ncbi:hypothetical protein [Tessaracoccus coleopterorum]
MVNLFFEDSTRTRSSFELAAKWLSADAINVSAKGSSVSKGESMRDTLMTLDAMGVDAIVMRHAGSGSVRQAAGWVRASMVNAGDGMHEHPTQALLDAHAIRRHLRRHDLGDIEGKRVAITGDLLHSRVVRSNVALLHKLGAFPVLVAPPRCCPRRRRLGCGGHHRLRFGASRPRRRHDAARPARADERRLLPLGARVHRGLRVDGDAPCPAQAGACIAHPGH